VCNRTGSPLNVRFDFTPKGNLAIDATHWAVTSNPLDVFTRGSVTWVQAGTVWTTVVGTTPGAQPRPQAAALSIQSASLSPDAKFVAVVGNQGRLVLSDLTKRVNAFPTAMASTIEVSWGAGNRLAYASATYNNAKPTASELTVGTVGPGPVLDNALRLRADNGSQTQYLGATLSPDGKWALVATAKPDAANTFNGFSALPLELRDDHLGVVRTYPTATNGTLGPFPFTRFSADGSHFLVSGTFADSFTGTRIFKVSGA
jgi:FlaG/FlaF family flagellin (archaellin)